jgi:hypothetical protein
VGGVPGAEGRERDILRAARGAGHAQGASAYSSCRMDLEVRGQPQRHARATCMQCMLPQWCVLVGGPTAGNVSRQGVSHDGRHAHQSAHEGDG